MERRKSAISRACCWVSTDRLRLRRRLSPQGWLQGLAPLLTSHVGHSRKPAASRSLESCLGKQSVLCPNWNSSIVLTKSLIYDLKVLLPYLLLHMFLLICLQWGPLATKLLFISDSRWDGDILTLLISYKKTTLLLKTPFFLCFIQVD